MRRIGANNMDGNIFELRRNSETLGGSWPKTRSVDDVINVGNYTPVLDRREIAKFR